jgi:hypothetical protein
MILMKALSGLWLLVVVSGLGVKMMVDGSVGVLDVVAADLLGGGLRGMAVSPLGGILVGAPFW